MVMMPFLSELVLLVAVIYQISQVVLKAEQISSFATDRIEALTSQQVAAGVRRADMRTAFLSGSERDPRPVSPPEHPLDRPALPLSALRPPVPFIGNGHFGKAREFRQQHEGRG